MTTVDGGLVVDRGESFSGDRFFVIEENGRTGSFKSRDEESIRKAAWAIGGSNHIVPLDVAKELLSLGGDIVDWQ